MKKILPIILAIALLGATPVRAEAERDAELLALAADSIVPDGSDTLRLAVCAMLINRKNDGCFPKSLAAVICDAGISLPSTQSASPRSLRAAADALGGSDPTCGALELRRERDEKARPLLVIDGYYFY